MDTEMTVRRVITYIPRQIKSKLFSTPWRKKQDEHLPQIDSACHDYKYFEIVRKHIVEGFNRYKIIPYFAFPLMIQARNIVELGSAFTYYPETYRHSSPWGVSKSGSEGLVSTRIFLTACRFLNKIGVKARLTSVDIRESSMVEKSKQLLKDLGLIQYWNPVMGTDSIKWLKEQKEPSDLALVDSQHTYAQVAGELKNLSPLMSSKGIIIVDDCYDLNYKPGATWAADETEEGCAKGGEYGAVLDFLEKHPEWVAEWCPRSIVSMVFLYKRGSIIGENYRR